jgi:hypothetical protein
MIGPARKKPGLRQKPGFGLSLREDYKRLL